jgi:hypothetical protein
MKSNLFRGRYLNGFFTHAATANSSAGRAFLPEDLTKYDLDQRNIIISGPPLASDPRVRFTWHYYALVNAQN